MTPILMKGVIRNGKVEVAEPINLPDGSEVLITALAGAFPDPGDNTRSMTPTETAEILAAMDRVESFEMTDEERASAEAWEKQVNDYTIYFAASR